MLKRLQSFPLGKSTPTIQLTPSASWNSFEQFRTSGATALATITAGTVGTLGSPAHMVISIAYLNN
jgi:hypothetical protein